MSDSIQLSPMPASVAVARRWSHDVLGRVGALAVSDTVALLVSELVSNVVLHARTDCSLTILEESGRIRVEVEDESDRLPGVRTVTDPLAQSGRGMQLIEGLSEAYGVDQHPGGGKRVWFELDLPEPAPSP